jgi:hypothetical protein
MYKITEILKAMPTQKIIGYILLIPAIISVGFFLIYVFEQNQDYTKYFLFGASRVYFFEGVWPPIPYTSLYVAFMALAGAYLIKDKK